jgi:hypothetical protein
MPAKTTPADLILAANRLSHLSGDEIKNHLYQSIATIRDMRNAVGIPGSGTERDAVIELLDTANNADTISTDALRSALLEAAEMIRTLRIVADSGVVLRLIDADGLFRADL